MGTHTPGQRCKFATALYEMLNPIPYGFFVAALIFDTIYVYSTNIMWTKSASWLITLGLIFAIIPRLVNLGQVWISRSCPRTSAVTLHFWLNAVAIAFAILNAFVHSRDAYAVVPQGVIYSAITVACLVIANLILSVCHGKSEGSHHA